MDKFIGKILLKSTQEEIKYMKRPINKKITELVMKFFPTKERSGAYGFPGEFYKTFRDMMPNLHKHFQNIEEDVTLSNFFYKAWYHSEVKLDKE